MKYQLISQESLSLQVPYAGTASVTTEHGVDADSCILSIIKIIINPLKDLKDFKVDPGQHKIRAAVSFSSLAFAEAWSSLSESAAANELSNIASCCSSSISLAVCCWICDSASDSLACEDSWGIQGIPRSTGHQVNMVTTWDMMRLGMAGFLFT